MASNTDPNDMVNGELRDIILHVESNGENLPTEAPVYDPNDVIDTELRDIRLEVEPSKDALFKESPTTGQRRRLLLALVTVFCLMVMIIVVAATTSDKEAGDDNVPTTSDKKPSDDNESLRAVTASPTPAPAPFGASPTHFTCPATEMSCPSAEANPSAWTLTGVDMMGEGEGDLAGRSIAMSCDGSVVAMGAPGNNAGGDSAGHARIYKYEQEVNEWRQLGSDLDGINERDQLGTSIALNADGTRVAVGARFNDGSDANAGHVRVFDYVDESWTLVGQDIEGVDPNDQTGLAVSLSASGSRLAIGGASNNVTLNNHGQARVYELDPERVWQQLGSDLTGEFLTDLFGKAVALSGDGTRVAVGGFLNDGEDVSQTDAGHVRVFEYNEEQKEWQQLGSDLNGPAFGSWFGFSLSLSHSGSILAVAAPGYIGYLPGLTIVYKLTNGDWVQHGEPIFGGYAVDLSHHGNRIVVGDFRGVQNGPSTGFASVYDFNGTDWVSVGYIPGQEAGELSGSAVAISADGLRVATSAPGKDILGLRKVGVVRAYDAC